MILLACVRSTLTQSVSLCSSFWLEPWSSPFLGFHLDRISGLSVSEAQQWRLPTLLQAHFWPFRSANSRFPCFEENKMVYRLFQLGHFAGFPPLATLHPPYWVSWQFWEQTGLVFSYWTLKSYRTYRCSSPSSWKRYVDILARLASAWRISEHWQLALAEDLLFRQNCWKRRFWTRPGVAPWSASNHWNFWFGSLWLALCWCHILSWRSSCCRAQRQLWMWLIFASNGMDLRLEGWSGRSVSTVL